MNTATTYSRNGFSRHGAREARPCITLPGVLPRIAAPLPMPEVPVRITPAPAEAQKHSFRRLFFRCTRLVLTGAVLTGATAYTRHIVTTATSEFACITADMVVLRAPIEGEVRLERDQLGQLVPKGTTLFTVHNSRPGNQESMSQLNWVRELTERLRAEAKEAAVRLEQQQEVFKINERLFREGLISRIAFLEEQTKVSVAKAALSSKEAQAYQAETRSREMERNAELCRDATVPMPFEGAIWSIAAKAGASIAAYAPVVEVFDPKEIWVEAVFDEKHAGKLHTGTPVTVQTLDGTTRWTGRVESVRSGVGRIASGDTVGIGAFTPHRVAVRVRMDASTSFGATEFFGLGRTVAVTLN